MKRQTRPSSVPDSPFARSMAHACLSGRLMILPGTLAIAYFGLCGFLLFNHLLYKEIYNEAEAFHMQYYWQFSQGQHCYYPNGTMINCATDGYTPLAAQIYGQVIRWLGQDVRIVRFVRALFGLGAIALVGLLVQTLTGERRLAFLATGLAAGMEPFWFMASGPDNMHVFWALLGTWLLTYSPQVSWGRAALAGAAFFASFWTKQTGLAYVVAGGVYLFLRNWLKGLVVLVVTAVVTLAGVLYFERLPDSDFLYWTWRMNADAPLIWSRLWDPMFFPIFFGRFLILTSLVIIGFWVERQFRWQALVSPWWILLGAAAFVGFFAGLKYGSGQSQSWFLYCMVIVVGVTMAHRLCRGGYLSPVVLSGLLAFQLAAFAQDFRPYVITRSDRERHAWLMNLIATPGKSVYYVGRTYWNFLAGKDYFARGCDGCYVRGEFRPEIYPKAWREYFESDPFDIVVVDLPPPDGFFPLYERLNKSYRAVQEIPADPRGDAGGCLRRKKIVFVRQGPQP